MDSPSSRSDRINLDFENLLAKMLNQEPTRPSTPGTLNVPQAATSMAHSPDALTRTASPTNAPAGDSPRPSTQGAQRVKITLRTKSPQKARQEPEQETVPQGPLIPHPNSNDAPRYDDLPRSDKMAKYIEENKAHLADLIAAEQEGFIAHIDESANSILAHEWIEFEGESEESQQALNEMFSLNYQLRIRVQTVKEVKRSPFRAALMTRVPFPMKVMGKYRMIVTFS